MRNPRDDRNANGVEAGLGVLFLAAFPMILWLFQGSTVVLISAVVQFGLLALALHLIARGQEIARAYDAARIAHRPRLPRKLLGSALLGLVVLILAGHQFQTAMVPLACGLVATGLAVIAFGVDPLRDKGLDDPAEVLHQQNRALLAEIETALAEALSRVAGLNDADLTRRTRAARDTILRLTRAAEQDADQLDKLRKPLVKITQMLGDEALRLESAWESAEGPFARRRYLAKLKLMVEKFEEIAVRGGVKAGRDAFDVEADLLLERMRTDTAA